MKRAPGSLVWALGIAALGIVLGGCEPSVPGPQAPNAAPATGSGARIQFATPVFDFQTAAAGHSLKYSFIFTNTGTQALEITTVRPDCGCTTAGQWTRRVEPGKTGVVPIEIGIAMTWPSGPITKTVTIESNDRSQPAVVLHIKGTVWKPIDVAPQIASFNLSADSGEATTSVKIINNTDELITLTAPEINNPAFAVALKTNKPGKEFELVVTARPPFPPGTAQAQISLKSSSSALRDISVPVYANVQPSIVVMPPRIVVRTGGVGRRLTPTINIQNNGTNSITLSKPAVSAKNVSVEIKEVEPGRTFTATLTFPPDFEIREGEQAMFSVETSHPGFPVIKVPIVQMPASLGPP